MLNVFVQCACDVLYDVACVWSDYVNVCVWLLCIVWGCMVCGVVVSYAVVCVGVCGLKCTCVLFVNYCVMLPGVACLLLLFS